jgi:DNA-binding response OmpR family regulator
MTTLSLTKQEFCDRQRLRNAERERIATERTEWIFRWDAAEKALVQEEAADLQGLMQELTGDGAMSPVPLVFDDDRRTIRWAGGKVRLGWKPYKFVKTLYEAEGQQMDMTDIETEIWGETSDINLHNVASRLRKKLEKEAPYFPYTVVSVTCEKQQCELEHNRLTTIRNAVSGFKLVRK